MSEMNGRLLRHRWIWLASLYSAVLMAMALVTRQRALRILELGFANLASYELKGLLGAAGDGLYVFGATMPLRVFLGMLAVAALLYCSSIFAGVDLRFPECLDMSAIVSAPAVAGAIVSLSYFLALPMDTSSTEAFDGSFTLMIPKPREPNLLYSLAHKFDIFFVGCIIIAWWLLSERTSFSKRSRLGVMTLTAAGSLLLLAVVHWTTGEFVFSRLGRLPY